MVFAATLLAMPVLARMFLPRFGDDNYVGPSKLTQFEVNALAKHAFPHWHDTHPDERCPASLSELDDIVVDAWGRAFQYTCDPRLLRAASPGIAITSAGEDGTFGTADDIGSDP